MVIIELIKIVNDELFKDSETIHDFWHFKENRKEELKELKKKSVFTFPSK